MQLKTNHVLLRFIHHLDILKEPHDATLIQLRSGIEVYQEVTFLHRCHCLLNDIKFPYPEPSSTGQRKKFLVLFLKVNAQVLRTPRFNSCKPTCFHGLVDNTLFGTCVDIISVCNEVYLINICISAFGRNGLSHARII